MMWFRSLARSTRIALVLWATYAALWFGLAYMSAGQNVMDPADLMRAAAIIGIPWAFWRAMMIAIF